MADKIETTRTMGIGFQWLDLNSAEKITYIKLPNPKANVQKEAINDFFNALAKGSGVTPAIPILLDKNGNQFTKWTDAYTETTTVTTFDIGVEG